MILPVDAPVATTVALTVVVDEGCTGCGLCLGTCPERALRPGPKRPLAEHDRCTGCLACVEVCPVDAIAVDVGRVGP